MYGTNRVADTCQTNPETELLVGILTTQIVLGVLITQNIFCAVPCVGT